MPFFCIDENNFRFPPVDQADDDGLLLVGGAVTPGRVLEAYRQGIFPWYNEEELPLWWTPDPRFVLFPKELHISKSMKKVFAKNTFQFRLNTAFETVIESCATIYREGQDGTWLTQEMKEVYKTLYHQGHAHSAETWKDDQLVGGVYGIRMGKVFFGESMFSKETNASKFAFISYVNHLKAQGVQLIDCQVYTSHVKTLGARLITRNDFLQLLDQLI